jgi:two-component sensor histidine kinase
MAEALQGRIIALARAHDLLRPAITGETSADTEQASFEALVREVLAPHLELQAAAGEHVRLTGPEFWIGPNAISSLALVLHELATNAVKYGSLSVSEGRLDVQWHMEADGLAVTWCERGGPPIAGPPAETGFGSMLSQQSVTSQLGGRIEFDWQAEGLVVRLKLPLGNLGR